MTHGIEARDLLEQVIRPTLDLLGLGGQGVEELLLGTAQQESGCGTWLAQQGGPALGVWQMEPKTHDDLWVNFLGFRPELAEKLDRLIFRGMPKTQQLSGNLFYACGMARVQYFRSPRPIPSQGDLEGQAALYKLVYNTPQGAASVDEYIANARRIGLGRLA